jgi:hypothetical protein
MRIILQVVLTSDGFVPNPNALANDASRPKNIAKEIEGGGNPFWRLGDKMQDRRQPIASIGIFGLQVAVSG